MQVQPRRKESLLTCLADLFNSIATQKKKVGVIPPKKFISRLRKENGGCGHSMVCVDAGQNPNTAVLFHRGRVCHNVQLLLRFMTSCVCLGKQHQVFRNVKYETFLHLLFAKTSSRCGIALMSELMREKGLKQRKGEKKKMQGEELTTAETSVS